MGVVERNISVEVTTCGIPFVVVDNFFAGHEKKKLQRELEFVRPHMSSPGTDIKGAHYPDGTSMKHNRSLFLHDFFADPNKSTVYNLTRQYYDPVFVSKICEGFWPAKYLQELPNFVADRIQVLYYEQSNTYDTHVDQAFLTCLYWTHKSPKKFKGGDIVLGEETLVEFKDNRLLVFPSPTKHRVIPVKMVDGADGYGRYCVSNFLHLNTL